MSKLITDYSSYSDSELAQVADVGLDALGKQKVIVFTNKEDINTAAALTKFKASMKGLSAGTNISTTQKNTDRVSLLRCMSILCSECNNQANGDLAILQSTALPISKTPESLVMGAVINFHVEHGKIAGTMDLSVDKPPYNHNGTTFAYWDPAMGVAPTNINKWFQLHRNGHSITIEDLVIGKNYLFSSAYKGNDSEALIWCPFITKMAAD